jgi:FkbH-like protein
MGTDIQVDVEHAELTDMLLTVMLSRTQPEDVVALVDRCQATATGFNKNVLESLLATIESHGLVNATSLSAYLTDESGWRNTDLGRWLVASLLELRGETQSALQAWNEVVNRHSGPIHEAHLNRARLLARLGELAGAYDAVRRALIDQTEYAFLARAAKVLARLRKQDAPASLRKARIALLSGTTTDLVAPLLQLACFRDGVDAEVYTAAYGSFRQEILDPGSGLYVFKPDFVIIATHWRDANLPSFSNTPGQLVEQTVNEFRQLWRELLGHHDCRVIQHNFDLPGIDAYGHLGTSLPGGRAHMLREVNRRLVEVAPQSVAIMDLDHVSAKYGKLAWFDAAYWHLARQYPAANALPMLVDHQVALIRAALGLMKKVLVLDLDNTMWGGVIGEDGLEGIRLGPPSAAGEAHQSLQQYALDLKTRGILLAVCSKNNEEDARLPFLRHDAMVLDLDDLAIFRANWKDKPANLREMATTLALGIDSFVFLDDNPVERGLVRQELPEIAVPELGPDPATFLTTLDRGLYFEAWTLSEEDLKRHTSYRSNVLRTELATSAASIEEYLHKLSMEAEIGPIDDSVLARVVQLIGKTNQFNLTTRRYSEQQIRRMMTSADYWTQYFRLKDRFGDNGLIGVMLAHRVPVEVPTWEIDTWLMSCRVIGRQMEEFMLQTLAEAAQAAQIRAIRGVYVPTGKNGMVADLYPKLGFIQLPESPKGESHYLLDLANQTVPRCEFIHIKGTPALVR